MEINTDIAFWENLYDRYSQWISEFKEAPILHLDIDHYDCHDPLSIKAIIKGIEQLKEDDQLNYLKL
jgi:deoxyadenosine/deoxycytidine kinase